MMAEENQREAEPRVRMLLLKRDASVHATTFHWRHLSVQAS